MIEEIQNRLDELKDLVYSDDATKKVVIKKLRNIKSDVSKYFASQKFSVKDMRTRQELLELISKLTHAINETEKQIMKMSMFDKDEVIELIMNLEETLIETIVQIHVIGEARPIIFDVKKDIEKKLKKETIKIPKDIEKYDNITINLYKVLKLAPPKEYSIKELVELVESDEEAIKKAIKNLEKEGYVEILYRGNEMVVKWTQ